MPRDVLSGGLGLESLVGGCECVKRLDELSRLRSEEMRFELSELEAGEIEVEVVGTSDLRVVVLGGGSVLGILIGETGMGRLEPIALVWETGQS